MTSLAGPDRKLSRRERTTRVLREGLVLLLTPVALAIILPFWRGHCTKERVQEYRNWRNLWPKPLPRFRREIQPSKGEFSQCGLFAKLPYELRCQIFEHLIEGRWNRRARTTSTFCLSSQSSQSSSRFHLGDSDRTLTNFLRTCRHIYAEVSFLLYTSSTFRVEGLQDIANFTYLSQNISQSSFASIKKLSINIQAWKSIAYDAKELRDAHPTVFYKERFRYPHSSAMDPHRKYPWRKLWSIVSTRMPGLESLILVLEESWLFRVRDTGCDTGSQVVDCKELSLVPEFGEEWVKPLLWVRGLKIFKLELRAASADAAFHRRFALLEQNLRKELCSASCDL